jgi:hypothetical protein
MNEQSAAGFFKQDARSGNNERIPSSLAGQMPRSVINPVTRRAGVTSKP